MNRRVLAVLVVAAGIGLAGCSAPAGLKALDREATAEDKLPESMSLTGVDLNVDAGTVRLLATDDGVRYFAARGSTAGTVCLIVAPEAVPERWRAACGGAATDEEILALTGVDGSTTKFIRDGVDASQPKYEGWKQIHENVLIVDR